MAAAGGTGCRARCADPSCAVSLCQTYASRVTRHVSPAFEQTYGLARMRALIRLCELRQVLSAQSHTSRDKERTDTWPRASAVPHASNASRVSTSTLRRSTVDLTTCGCGEPTVVATVLCHAA